MPRKAIEKVTEVEGSLEVKPGDHFECTKTATIAGGGFGSAEIAVVEEATEEEAANE